MDIRPVRAKRDYETALRRIEALMNAKAGADEGDELEIFATLVDVYEAKHFPMGAADPVKERRHTSGIQPLQDEARQQGTP
jgi:HTH-type transcriptional regulator / antitoxin HigA